MNLAMLVSKIVNEDTFIKATITSIASTIELIPPKTLRVLVKKDIDPLRVLKIPPKILLQSYEIGIKFRGKGLSSRITVDAVLSHLNNKHRELLRTEEGRRWLYKWFVEPIQVFLR